MPKHLLVADADRIQEYLFESVGLKEIMGASLILSQFNQKVEEKLKGKAEVLYSKGGVVRVQVADEGQKQAVADLIRLTYYELTKTGNISLSNWATFSDDKSGFDKAMHEADLTLRDNKNAGSKVQYPVLASPYMVYCKACGLRAAAKTFSPNKDEPVELLCETCSEKRRALRQAQKSQGTLFYPELNAFLAAKNPKTFDKPLRGSDDFNSIGVAGSPSGYVGFIVADGNQIGKRFADCKNKDQYKQLSDHISTTLDTALNQAISVAFNLHNPDGLKKYQRDPEHPNETHPSLPLQVLVKGGDDLVIVTTADTALPLATLFCQFFSEISREKGDELSISAGVVLAKANLPFLISYELAKNLLRSAKRLSRQSEKPEGVGSLDFQVVTASNALDLKTIREELTFNASNSSKNKLIFTDRPYSTERAVQLFTKLAEFKNPQSPLPRSQLALLTALFQPAYAERLDEDFEKACYKLDKEYSRLINRLPSTLREKWHELENLGEGDEGVVSSFKLYRQVRDKPIERRVAQADLIEIFEFIGSQWDKDGDRWKYNHE